MATTLQTLEPGLPAFTPVEPWLFDHPDAIREVHHRFVTAGAHTVLTATFLAATRPDWRSCVDRAVDLARSAEPSAVWLALGPVDTEASADTVVAYAQSRGVDGVVLETVVDGRLGLERLAACRAVWDGPLVLSMVPAEGGRTHQGEPLAEVAARTMELGASGFGINCVSGALAEDAVAAVPEGIPLWIKPSATDAAIRRLHARATWIGGCCGTTPADLSRWRAAFSS